MSDSGSSSASSSPRSTSQRPYQDLRPTLSLSILPTSKPATRTPSMTSIPEDAHVLHETSRSNSLADSTLSPYGINHDLKTILTDLLNSEAIRQDDKMRLYVQTRLMEAERQLKRQRKRRVSAPTIVLSPSEDEFV
ncbi:hypothetical protein LTR62_001189 [Meristemomyces frigidus]|uniref:Uncharacterized protein n=1 Tax=Meristemomyces frigidus TaxID=1508187 RepID=A0AAN7YQN9_9PEZI|nr:hypothetical protein LTR62_001189 [Meristemomyces frigidus]